MTGFVLQGHIAFSKSTLSDLSTLQVHSRIHRGIVVYAQLFSVRDWFVSEGTGLLFCAAVCGASSRRKDPEARGPSAVIHFLFRLALFLSSVIMAALKHYQPCLQIWNPKVSDFPSIIYIACTLFIHIGPLPGGEYSRSPVISRLGSFIIIIRGNFWQCVVWVMLPHFLLAYIWKITRINLRKMTFCDELRNVCF